MTYLRDQINRSGSSPAPGPILKLLKLTNTDPFAAWFVVTGDATPDGIRVVWSVLGAISNVDPQDTTPEP